MRDEMLLAVFFPISCVLVLVGVDNGGEGARRRGREREIVFFVAQ